MIAFRMVGGVAGICVLMTVEPVFSRSAGFADPAEKTGIAHFRIVQCHTEQIHTTPALHGLRR